MAQPADYDALRIETEELINSHDIKPFEKLIASALQKQKEKKNKNPKAEIFLDYFKNNYPKFLVGKLVIVLTLWHDNADSPDEDKLMYLNLLNSVLDKLDKQPSTVLIHDHLLEIKPIVISVLKKETFSVDFNHVSKAITIMASQVFQLTNRNKKWTELLDYICDILKDGSKFKMGLMLLRDFPLNVDKTWYELYIEKIKPFILNHLGECEEKKCWVLAFGALVNLALQLGLHKSEPLSEQMVETVKRFLKNGKAHFVKIVFENLLVFLKREGWRCDLYHFRLLSKFAEEVKKMDRLVEKTRTAVLNLLNEVERREGVLKAELHDDRKDSNASASTSGSGVLDSSVLQLRRRRRR